MNNGKPVPFGQNQPKFGMILPIVLLSYALILIDNSIVATSATAISQGLHMGPVALSWVTNAYTITFGSLLLFAGRVGDFIGRKRIFLVGLLIFGLSSLAVGLSVNATQIITARAIQGIGAAIIAPNSLAILLDNYQGEQRSKAIAYYGITAAVGSSVGLLVGGFFSTLIGWEAGFLINVPYALTLLVMSGYYVVGKRPVGQGKLDGVGALLSILTAGSFVYGVVEREALVFVLSLVLLVIFLFHENRKSNPLMPLVLFKSRIRSGSYLGRFIFMMFMMSYWFLLPQLLYKLLGFTPLQAGLTFLTLTLAQTVAAFGQGKLPMGYQAKINLGQGLMLIGSLLTLIGLPNVHNFIGTVEVPMILIGLGAGCLLAPLTYAGVQGIAPDLSGAASGVTNTMHQLGGPFGIALIVMMTSAITNVKTLYFMIMAGLIIYTAVGFLSGLLIRFSGHQEG
ncbi:MFS transporter [Leuconostocaceae bacterium ESL0723]|nr:MFS transporter [Leuconostocaceae bacterium ESL0723]